MRQVSRLWRPEVEERKPMSKLGRVRMANQLPVYPQGWDRVVVVVEAMTAILIKLGAFLILIRRDGFLVLVAKIVKSSGGKP